MSEAFPLGPGSQLMTAMLSPCVGGLVRTWTDEGSCLWSVSDDRLATALGQGRLARTRRAEDRFREVALLHRESGSLMLQPRFPDSKSEDSLLFENPLIRLTPAGQPRHTVFEEFRSLLRRAVDFTVASGGFLVVELGGWNAPSTPYCLFIVMQEGGSRDSLVETAPVPHGAQLWADHIEPGLAGATLRAPATADTVGVVPTLIMDACATWDVAPWDLALTYGRRS